ncbi:VRR-NUC domain-containing protein [Linnemannia elongata]|nr:VRR-NUC domain-containing protein [Linnemannia elongata]
MLLPPRFRWKTVYVAAFELALDTVLPEEAFLFTDEEHTLFETYRALSDDPKHLFVRLFLRNQKYWFRQSKLEGHYREIDDLESSIRQLITTGLLMDQESVTVPAEVLGILAMDELKILCRRIGIKEKLSGKPRSALVSTILDHFRQQSFISKRLLLAPGGTNDGDGEARLTGLTTHVFSGDATRRDRALINKVIDISGPCVKIYPNIIKVFERLHLVFYRAREYNEKPALLEAILAKIGQRTFPTYEITRTSTVFKNRDELIKYETAIRLHFDLSKMTESAMGPGRDATNVIKEAENIREAWRHYVATETELSRESPNYFMLRFSPGWVYTQILRLELRAFAFLKRFEEESILLHELLDQHIYSLGQRGGWYERLALIKSNYSFHKRLGKQEALQVCMMALRDKHVHAVDATLIQARIVRLESELKVAYRERHDFSYLTLRKAQKRILSGERLNAPGMVAPSYTSSHSYSFVPNSMGSSHPIANQRPLWRNIDGSDCNVEELALSYYGTLGYKGYHSENSLLATLFGLLFWDILFSPQPGVFETHYQTEPLDLRTDAFFLQRQDMILDRIARIAGSTIIENNLSTTHDDLYRDKKVYCVGVNWTFTKEELLEVAECIGGNALAEICKILAQEYNKRCSGMPDLCCWDYDKKLVKFVEVKGPGDRLSSKQQVWIDLLTSLHVDIELCIVQVSKAEDEFLEERKNVN